MGETEAVRRIQELAPPGLPLTGCVTLHRSLQCPGFISSPVKWDNANQKSHLILSKSGQVKC